MSTQTFAPRRARWFSALGGAVAMTAAAFASAVALAAPSSATVPSVLFAQGPNNVNSTITSSTYTGADENRMGAEDFTVPEGATWNLTQVNTWAAFYGALPASMTVTIYNDASGLPGTPVATESGLSYTRPEWYMYQIYKYAIPLSSTVTLGSGHYWVSVQGWYPAYAGGWMWADTSISSGNQGAFQDGMQYSSCQAWAPMSQCFPSDPNSAFAFEVVGVAGALDDTPPVVNLSVSPDPVLQGLTATATFTATDAESAISSTSCEPTFAVDTSTAGQHTITCSATSDGGTNSASYTYTVLTPSQGITNLEADVTSMVPRTQQTPLVSLLESAKKSLAKGDFAGADTKMDSFVSQVKAQSGKKLTVDTANLLIGEANNIIASIAYVS